MGALVIAAFFIVAFLGFDRLFAKRNAYKGHVELRLFTFPVFRSVLVRTGKTTRRFGVDEVTYRGLTPGRSVDYLCVEGGITGITYSQRLYLQVRSEA